MLLLQELVERDALYYFWFGAASRRHWSLMRGVSQLVSLTLTTDLRAVSFGSIYTNATVARVCRRQKGRSKALVMSPRRVFLSMHVCICET
jgi:hypothetical protein